MKKCSERQTRKTFQYTHYKAPSLTIFHFSLVNIYVLSHSDECLYVSLDQTIIIIGHDDLEFDFCIFGIKKNNNRMIGFNKCKNHAYIYYILEPSVVHFLNFMFTLCIIQCEIFPYKIHLWCDVRCTILEILRHILIQNDRKNQMLRKYTHIFENVHHTQRSTVKTVLKWFSYLKLDRCMPYIHSSWYSYLRQVFRCWNDGKLNPRERCIHDDKRSVVTFFCHSIMAFYFIFSHSAISTTHLMAFGACVQYIVVGFYFDEKMVISVENYFLYRNSLVIVWAMDDVRLLSKQTHFCFYSGQFGLGHTTQPNTQNSHQ